MIYLDNAATTYPKPNSVVQGIVSAVRHYGGNPGRSGHAMSLRAADMVYETRKKAAELFRAEPENIIFTGNCTHALNMAIKGAVAPGSHVIISALEHNAVLRPVYAMSQNAEVTYSFALPAVLPEDTVRAFERLITPETTAIICTHASNLSGKIMPIEALASLCEARGLAFIVDAAQSAGVLPIDVSRLGRCVVCMAGHKGLYGTTGTGMMIPGGGIELSTIMEGGTGSLSAQLEQPDFTPDRFESGTVNTVGILSLKKGMEFISRRGLEHIYRHEMALCQPVFEAILCNPRLRAVDSSFAYGTHVPVLSFTHMELGSTEVGERMDRVGIAVRSGLHCAPLAHEFYHTKESGAVRISPSAFTTKSDMDYLVRQIKKL